MDIKKIMCFCASSLGTSLVIELNAKKALQALGRDDIEVVHSTIEDVKPGSADLYICTEDLLMNAGKAGPAIGIRNLMSVDELTLKLKDVLDG